MKIGLNFGLFFLYLLAVSLLVVTANTDAEAYNYDEYEEDYNYNDEYSDEEIEITSSTTKRPTTPTTTTQATSIEEDHLISKEVEEEFECPVPCECTDAYRFIYCAKKNLTGVPKHLPKNTFKLDLSDNNIKHLDAEDFYALSDMRELILAGNVIEDLDRGVFTTLKRLENVDLSSNMLRHIQSDTFEEAINLKKLILDNNPIEMPQGEPFLNAPDLQELSLVGCNFTDLYQETFSQMNGLWSLNLAKNQLDGDMDLNVFTHLQNYLKKLTMPELSQDKTAELCDILTAIDLINFPTFAVSCFELVSGTSFEESVVTIDALTVDPITEENKLALPDLTTPAPTNKTLAKIDGRMDRITTTTTTTTSKALTTSSTERITVSLPRNNQTEKRIVDRSLISAISAETINHLLIGIILVTLFGLTVGIIFRRDCFGIKTKMCRTSTRPPPTDLVRPAEEVPLNKA